MENKELYSYLVGSINVINKSLLLNEQNTVQLFSYLYNNIVDIDNKLNKLENSLSYFNNYNIEKINKLENDIPKLNYQYQKLNKDIKLILKNIKEKTVEKNNNENQIEIIKEKKYYLKDFINKIIIFFKDIYNKCYKIIFRKRILRKQQEEEIRLEKEAKEKAKLEEQRKKELIKKILNKK